jgi:hypothetical protein
MSSIRRGQASYGVVQKLRAPCAKGHMQINKTDRNDARGMAQMKPVGR